MNPKLAPTLVDRSLPTPAENLALDEALLRECDAAIAQGSEHAGFLRLWESTDYFVVLGISRPIEGDVDREACGRRKIPILRRASGGGTVLQGPGCLNVAVVLPIELDAALGDIQGSYAWIVDRVLDALELDGTNMRGSSDLAIGDVKFGGSAQKRTPRAVLHHATLLYDFDLALVAETLREPDKQPDYRGLRKHHDFIRNIELTSAQIRERLSSAWNAQERGFEPPSLRTLIDEKYGRDSWHERF